MEIIGLNEKFEGDYFACLEDWSDEIKEGGSHKELWFRRRTKQGLRVKLALVDGKAVGMIQYVPIEHAFAEGRDLYFIHCIWVHGYKGKGVGNQQKRGVGKALLAAAEDDARALGAKGMAAWGVGLPFFMRASWFKKHGFQKVDKNAVAQLLWKPFTDDAVAPKWIREKKKPELTPGKVTVSSFKNGWCPAMNMVFERAKRAAAEFGEAVDFKAVDTSDRAAFLDWGIADALFIDGKAVRTGPPPSYEKIRRKIARRARKIKKGTRKER
jgi:N-acetylglutamate synthase-like GNAT family acetyltransferase